jgi:Mrp family chromosome partitioning ATPase
VSIFDRRLLVVTGKGGVGKTTLVAAIGLAAARSGQRALLVELAGQQRLARLFNGEEPPDSSALRAAAEAELLAAGVAATASARAAGALADEQALADRDRAGIERLARRLGAEPVLEVPILAGDVHDVPGLDRLDEHLFVSPD